LPKCYLALNAFEISDIQEYETEAQQNQAIGLKPHEWA